MSSVGELHPELKSAIASVAETPPAGMSSVDWTALLAKLLPLIIQIIQVFAAPHVGPGPGPTPTP